MDLLTEPPSPSPSPSPAKMDLSPDWSTISLIVTNGHFAHFNLIQFVFMAEIKLKPF